MTKESAIESYLSLKEVSKDVFENSHPFKVPFGNHGIFGGCFISQSLHAATLTVDAKFRPYSIHCNFLVAGDPTLSLRYRVERLRDGKNYSHREVKVYQEGKLTFICTVSFQSRKLEGSAADLGPQLRHQKDAPIIGKDVLAPEAMIDAREAFLKWYAIILNKLKLENMPSGEEILSQVSPNACEWRLPEDYMDYGKIPEAEKAAFLSDNPPNPANKTFRHWFRARPTIKDPRFHEIALAYGSDMFLLSVTNRAFLRHFASAKFSVSLDHTIYFHEEFKADEWMCFCVRNTRTGDNRSLVTADVFTREGKIAATVVQEGLVVIDRKRKSKL
ncbi:hypothetical protein PACTADRAFT_76467 [Pachysolen tannophilus NRRL Y-2460]|uniref:Acyl-CoA thioesterase II n=1 Tax=Pachysolen tannophilus NRRL Y-2460 TaxID=669874 RepID=A0A1E4TSZ9_PACTA|nr:hypothetical protein PACTADRAFT_76467 [Pachysolen tannophilus NRRL Y-2460]